MAERWDDFLRYPAERPSPRASHRKVRHDVAIDPDVTLAEARARHIWIWVCCAKRACSNLLSVPLAPLIIRWGGGMPMKEVRRRWRCGRCGGVGVYIYEPCWERADLRCVSEAHRWTGEPGRGPRFGVARMT